MKTQVYAYGGGNYRRFSSSVTSIDGIHEAVDAALDKGYRSITITVNEASN